MGTDGTQIKTFMEIEITENEVLELKLLRDRLERERLSERHQAAKRAHSDPEFIRTTDRERENDHAIETLNHIITRATK